MCSPPIGSIKAVCIRKLSIHGSSPVFVCYPGRHFLFEYNRLCGDYKMWFFRQDSSWDFWWINFDEYRQYFREIA